MNGEKYMTMKVILTRKIRRYLVRRSNAGKNGRNPLDSCLIFTEVTAQVLNDQITLKMKNARVAFSFSNEIATIAIVLREPGIPSKRKS